MGHQICRMENVARWLMLAGVVLFLAGGGMWLLAKWGVPLGRLPGDIRMEGSRGTFYFPIVTSIVVSIVLTVVLNLLARFFGK